MSAQELPTNPQLAATRPQRSAGRHLTLVGVTPDGTRLRMADAVGTEFTVEIDPRLRAALGGEPRRRTDHPAPTSQSSSQGTSAGRSSGKVESPKESMLRPRDIQARIRAGETPEQVAAAAQTTVEKVMPYAAPVLAEREHVAERAQRSSIRRAAGEPQQPWHSAARTLGDAITAHLHGRNIDPEGVTWDAWRREDGRWSITGRYSIQGQAGLAELTFDPPGNFVFLDNDDARWLVGELPEPVAEPEPEAQPEAGVRRLAAVPEEQPTLGDDVLGIADSRDGYSADQPLEAFLDDQPGLDETALRDEAADAAALDDTGEPAEPGPHDHEPPSRRPVKKTRGRASVPSWDEIMFGGPGDGPSAGDRA
jgi:hypothetical protein